MKISQKRLLSTDIEYLWLEFFQALIRLSLTPEELAQEEKLFLDACDDLMIGPNADSYRNLLTDRYVVGSTKYIGTWFTAMHDSKKLFKELGWEVKLTFPGQVSNEFIRSLKPGLKERLLNDEDFKANGPNWTAAQYVGWIDNLYYNGDKKCQKKRKS